jgi:hypothetical protein
MVVSPVRCRSEAFSLLARHSGEGRNPALVVAFSYVPRDQELDSSFRWNDEKK